MFDTTQPGLIAGLCGALISIFVTKFFFCIYVLYKRQQVVESMRALADKLQPVLNQMVQPVAKDAWNEELRDARSMADSIDVSWYKVIVSRDKVINLFKLNEIIDSPPDIYTTMKLAQLAAAPAAALPAAQAAAQAAAPLAQLAAASAAALPAAQVAAPAPAPSALAVAQAAAPAQVVARQTTAQAPQFRLQTPINCYPPRPPPTFQCMPPPLPTFGRSPTFPCTPPPLPTFRRPPTFPCTPPPLPTSQRPHTFPCTPPSLPTFQRPPTFLCKPPPLPTSQRPLRFQRKKEKKKEPVKKVKNNIPFEKEKKKEDEKKSEKSRKGEKNRDKKYKESKKNEMEKENCKDQEGKKIKEEAKMKEEEPYKQKSSQENKKERCQEEEMPHHRAARKEENEEKTAPYEKECKNLLSSSEDPLHTISSCHQDEIHPQGLPRLPRRRRGGGIREYGHGNEADASAHPHFP